MSKNIQQVYTDNPIVTNQSTDLMYFGRAPYGTGDDTAMQFSDFAAQFGNPYTPSALTRIDDTNVTLTLGGTPNTALLQPVSLTLSWTGQLSVPRGGTGAASFTAFSVICGGLTSTGALQSVVGVGAIGEQLTSNGPGALPTWQAGTVITPAAMTKTDDTNVTLTLGGSPATSLLAATSLTLGWTGLLSPARGGTGVNNGTNTLTLAGNLSTVGAFPAVFNFTASTNVTFPVSGTLATVSGTVSSITGTANQVIASASTGAVTLSLPQSIGTGNSPTFAGLTLTNPYIAGAGGLHSFQIFTSGTAATYTRPSNVKSILIEVVGGGGGGGGSTGGASTSSFGGPGGAGGYARLFVASAASSYTYTVGAGGAGGTAGNNVGSTGGTTSFNASSLQATGGAGGNGSASSVSPQNVIGGVGGIGSNGDINISGNMGGWSAVIASASVGIPGSSGGGYFGGSVASPGLGAGTAGKGFGSGGGGALSTTTSFAGGAGAGGIIIVWEFA